MFQSGQQIGNYTLVKKLGSGSFGEVWLALRRAKFVTTRVAVKLPLREVIDHDEIKREAILWEKASGHPNVLPIIEADEYDGQIVIVSEFATDGSLEDRLLADSALPVRTAVEMALGIAQGLKFLHSRRIIHRDIKPANILLQGDIPRLTDFGLSRFWMGNSMSAETSGTPFYMAPEAFGRKRNEQTDVWSFGVVLYEMLTGRMPFLGADVAELYASVLNEAPRPLPREIPDRLQEIVFKALEKSPARRYASVAEMLEDLQNVLFKVSADALSKKSPGARADRSFARSTAEPISAPARESGETRFKPTENLAPPKQTDEIARQPAKRRFFRFGNLAAAAFLLILTAFGAGFLILRGRQPIPFRQGDKFGYSTWRKELVIGAKYDLAMPFFENRALVALSDKNRTAAVKYGFIDMGGREVIAPEYDRAESFSDGLAKVGKVDPATGKTLYGFIDPDGVVRVPLNFEDAGGFSEKLAAVKTNGKWGFIDLTGAVVVSFEYDSAGVFSDGYAVVKTGGKYGFIDRAGNVAIAPVFDSAGNFTDGAAPVEQNGKAFFVDAKGAELLRLKYDRANFFAEGLAMVTRNGKAGFIGKDGVEVVPFQFEDEKTAFAEGLADVRLNGKKGFIDHGGKTVIGFKYAEASPFKNRLARVKTDDGKEFYIGHDGTEFYTP